MHYGDERMNCACDICKEVFWEIDPFKTERLLCSQECKIRWIVRDEMEKIMPLLKGEKNIGKNIKTEEASGKKKSQAIAISLNVAGKSKKKK